MGKYLAIFALSFCLLKAATCASVISKEVGDSRELKNIENLDDNGKIVLGWEVDSVAGVITFEIEAETTGYVGFGISPQGSMTGADIFIAGVNADGTPYYSDRFGTGFETPKVDDHADWTLLNALESNGKTYLRFSRLLNSCDEEDYPITKDTNRIIWAMGASDTIEYHKTTGRGSKSLNLLAAPIPEVDLTRMTKWEMTLEMQMPEADTAYWCSFHKGPILNKTHHIVAFDAFLPDPLAIQHTHHFIIYNCYLPPGSNETMDDIFGNWTVEAGYKGDFCYKPSEQSFIPNAYCMEYLFVWAKGGKKYVLPETLGYPIGEENNGKQQYYMMEIHYDNPEKRNDATFNTGVTMYYTDALRPIRAGQLTIGHDVNPALLVPPNESNFIVSGHCSPGCTNKFPEGGITVFNAMLHSHLSGRKLKVRHFRNGEELEWLDFDDHYDFNYQQNKPLTREVKVLPGDQLIYECTYDSTWKNGSVVIGDLSTRDEMCEAFLWYYPKMDVDICGSSYDMYRSFGDLGITNITSEMSVGRNQFKILQPEYLKGDFEESMSFKFNWTDAIRERLQDMRRFGVHQSVCKSRLSEEEPELEFVTYPHNFNEYVPDNICSRNDTGGGGRIVSNLFLGLVLVGAASILF